MVKFESIRNKKAPLNAGLNELDLTVIRQNSRSFSASVTRQVVAVALILSQVNAWPAYVKPSSVARAKSWQ